MARRSPLDWLRAAVLIAGCASHGELRPETSDQRVLLSLNRLVATSGQDTTGTRPAAGVTWQQASAQQDQRGVQLLFRSQEGAVDIPPAMLDVASDWRGFSRLVVEVDNGAAPATVELAVLGRRGRLVDSRDLGAGASASLKVDLNELALAGDERAPFVVETLRLRSTSPWPGARSVTIKALWLEPLRIPRGPCVDAFGQRVGGDWPGKVRRPDDLRAAIAEETAALAAMPLPRDRDDYGGWTKGEVWQGNGFFGVDRDGGGRHWFVNPQGRAFWSLGATTVRTTDMTVTAGREFLFAALPVRGTPDFHDAVVAEDGLEGVAFYRWNVLRKWSSVAAWRDRTLERFDRWGLNTLGALTTEQDLLLQKRVPHTRSFKTLEGSPALRTPTGFPDVFDPRWVSFVDRQAATHAAPHQGRAWLLGTFVDDEVPWNDLRLLDLPRGTPLRERWLGLLKERHGTLEQLSRAWGAQAPSWEAVRDMAQAGVPAGRAREDLAGLEGLFAETYFATVAEALRRHDPNHLYLGCRFSREPPHNEEIVRAAGRHVDVVSVNDRAAEPDRRLLERWHALAGEKPLLISGQQVPLASVRQVTLRPEALGPSARRRAVASYLTRVAAIPFVVGVHWSQYADEPLTGRGGSGGNQLVGLVDVTDRPHEDLVAGLREAALKIYEQHAGAR